MIHPWSIRQEMSLWDIIRIPSGSLYKSHSLMDRVLIYGLIIRWMHYLSLNARTYSINFDTEIPSRVVKKYCILYNEKVLVLTLLIVSSAGMIVSHCECHWWFSLSLLLYFPPFVNFLFLLQYCQCSEDMINVNFSWYLLKRSTQHFGCTIDL